ncbi:DUF6912 family protein [Actinotalea fermentans]|uniref:Uncharacterized protein n=1 Tax=Actinotalea fermentans TaxID=43671 RepID=A0A511YT08_9CELL|nr:hypothetical protein [Actinotalea fermentans]KGM15418.1 hypothetical protein N867_08565 [Actinotalea fermentans ATCC 43279 = JCM 9966 = DSM 3133]GEN78323.1 hypothetical protein AFE02nite_00570 [Actinotalea fermentans]
MRIYVPSTLAELDPSRGLQPRLVHAVTSALRAALPDEDEEGLEYAAQLLAADDSLDRLEGTDAPRRRVVVAVDVPEAVVEAVDDPHAPSVVRLTIPVGWDDVACAHVDEAAAEADVVAALAGDDDAVERLAERDLLWYDSSELDRLAAGSLH